MNKNAIQFIESCLNMNIFYKFLYYFLSFRGAALYHFGSAAASAADGGVDMIVSHGYIGEKRPENKIGSIMAQ